MLAGCPVVPRPRGHRWTGRRREGGPDKIRLARPSPDSPAHRDPSSCTSEPGRFSRAVSPRSREADQPIPRACRRAARQSRLDTPRSASSVRPRMLASCLAKACITAALRGRSKTKVALVMGCPLASFADADSARGMAKILPWPRMTLSAEGEGDQPISSVRTGSESGRPAPSPRSRSPSGAQCDTRSTAVVLATAR